MRKLLNGLYRMSGQIAGFCLVLIGIIVVLQVIGNLIDRILQITISKPIGINITSYADFAGFLLAAATFLSLGYTLNSGEHVRVNLVLSRLSRRWRQLFELWCLALSAVFTSYFVFYTALLVKESIDFGDYSVSSIPVPMWLPQSFMLLGLVVLVITFIDGFFIVARGGQPPYVKSDEMEKVERG